MKIEHHQKEFCLRALEPEDIDYLYELENDESLWQFGVSNVPYSKEVLRRYIMSSHGDIYADGQVRMVLETDKRETIGLVDLLNFDPRNLRAELALVIQSDYRNKGLGEAVVKKICSYARNVLHLHQLYAYVEESNAACLACLGRAGFEEGARLAEWIYDGRCFKTAILLQYFL